MNFAIVYRSNGLIVARFLKLSDARLFMGTLGKRSTMYCLVHDEYKDPVDLYWPIHDDDIV